MTHITRWNITPVQSKEKKEKECPQVRLTSCPNLRPQWICLLLLFIVTNPLWAQIGGKTAAHGIFVLEDVEDLDTSASGVGRTWIPDFVPGPPGAFQAVNLNSSDFSYYANQSSNAALRYNMISSYGYINYSFGVPMPGTVGASTLTSPGNITSFTHLSFLITALNPIVDQTPEVILETYPGSGTNFPSIRWKYELVNGRAFQEITLDLRHPTYILNQKGIPLEELLGQTRYLAFYFYGGPVPANTSYSVHVDDIRLTGYSQVPDWTLY